MIDRVPPTAGWRFDRRTFLKMLGIGGVGLLAAGPFGSLLGPWTVPRVAAAAGPIDDLALALEFDMERIFRFVSDEVRYEPYAGVLRGAEGTLMGRAGNSADQAVLLAALLEAAGIRSRFVHGPVDAETADAIYASAVTDPATVRRELIEGLTGMGQGGRPFVLPERDAETRARADDEVAQAEHVVAWTEGQLDDTVAMIGAALAEAGVTLPTGFSAMPALERDSHVWVQAVWGPTRLDLDPSLPGARPGDAPATSAAAHEAVPDWMRHRLTFVVIGETIADGALHRETLLEVEDFADVLGLTRIGLINVEQQGLAAVGANIVTALEGGTAYLPCLILGDSVVVGPGAIRFGGDPDDPFGVLGPTPAGVAEGEPTAEWLEITIASPGTEPIVVTRALFDRVGPAIRAGGSFDPRTLPAADLVQLDPATPLDYLPAQTSHWFTVHTGLVGGDELRKQLDPDAGVASLPATVHAYHVAREAASAALALPRGTRAFIDAPNIVSLTIEQDFRDGGGLTVRPTFDIWHRSFGNVPLIGDRPADPPTMIAGIIAHLAERILVGDPMRPVDSDAGPSPSVGAVFDTARREGIPIRAVLNAEDVDFLPFSPDALARLAARLESGYVAIVPERPVLLGDQARIGWWLVDLATGRVVDEIDGRGALPEYAEITLFDVTVTVPVRRLADCIVIGAIAATFLLWARVGVNVLNSGGDLAPLGAVITLLSVGGFAGVSQPVILGGFQCGI